MRWFAWLLLFIHSCVGNNKLSHFSYAKKKNEKKTWKKNVEWTIFSSIIKKKSFGKCSPGMKEVQKWWKIGCKHEYELSTTNVQAIIKMQKKKNWEEVFPIGHIVKFRWIHTNGSKFALNWTTRVFLYDFKNRLLS